MIKKLFKIGILVLAIIGVAELVSPGSINKNGTKNQ